VSQLRLGHGRRRTDFNVRADRAQPVVRVIQVWLEHQSLLYFRDGVDMPEIVDLAPQPPSVGKTAPDFTLNFRPSRTSRQSVARLLAYSALTA
jgi:hypothetical protein